MTDYEALIIAQLDRLRSLNTQRAQRDATIRAIAEARYAGDSETEVFGKKYGKVKTIGKRTYYAKSRAWYHNELFMEVLGNVAELIRQREDVEREKADKKARDRRHRERVALINKGKSKLEPLIDNMNVDDVSPTQVASFMKAILSEERTEFDEVPASRATIDATTDGKPLANMSDIDALIAERITKARELSETGEADG